MGQGSGGHGSGGGPPMGLTLPVLTLTSSLDWTTSAEVSERVCVLEGEGDLLRLRSRPVAIPTASLPSALRARGSPKMMARGVACVGSSP